MRIRVQVFGDVVNHQIDSNGGNMVLDIPEGARVEKVLERLGISSGLVGIVLVNGKFSNKDVLLQHNDQIQIIPQLEGG
jgi:sulfur carrier protein ThiS